MQKIYRIKTSPCARQENMIIGNQYRITVLTEGLVRLEYNADGEFEDRATQMVLYRDFPEVDYRVIHTENGGGADFTDIMKRVIFRLWIDLSRRIFHLQLQ